MYERKDDSRDSAPGRWPGGDLSGPDGEAATIVYNRSDSQHTGY
jgi:hypothetical protein